MSRKVSSSAPSASYTRAISTGSPASRRLAKLTPLTTRPASTSRHGMTRIATLMRTSPQHSPFEAFLHDARGPVLRALLAGALVFARLFGDLEVGVQDVHH